MPGRLQLGFCVLLLAISLWPDQVVIAQRGRGGGGAMRGGGSGGGGGAMRGGGGMSLGRPSMPMPSRSIAPSRGFSPSMSRPMPSIGRPSVMPSRPSPNRPSMGQLSTVPS